MDGKQLTIGSNKKLEGSGTDNTIQVKHGQPSLLFEDAVPNTLSSNTSNYRLLS